MSNTVSAFPVPNGEYLLKNCSESANYTPGRSYNVQEKDIPSLINHGNCVGYINGINSSEIYIYQKQRDIAQNIKFTFPRYCLPNNISMHQQILVLLKYLKENPQFLHEPAINLVLNAFSESFPCKD